MDWEQIEKDFIDDVNDIASLKQWQSMWIVKWFKDRILPHPPEKLTDQERNEFYTTDVTADIKANYERKT
ncbi:MAG: hypothetical protein WAS34_18910 [Thiolinea sp.]